MRTLDGTMAALVITQAATDEIRRRFASSRCNRPTASLMDSSQTFPAPSDLVDAISRKEDASELLKSAMKEYGERKSILDFRLEVGVYEADDCRPEDLVLLNGLQFAMRTELRDYFTDYALDYADSRFFLTNGRKVFVRLMDLEDGNDSAV